MFPFLVKPRMADDSRTLEMANVGPGSYSPTNAMESEPSKQVLKQNGSFASSKHNTSSFLDPSSNKVISVGQANGGACFGSGQGRFDESERLLAKVPSKIGPGAYANINYKPKGQNFSTRFNNLSGMQ